MDDAGAVGGVEGPGQKVDRAGCGPGRLRPSLHVFAERTAVDPFQHQVRTAIAGAAVVDLNDVGVTDAGRSFRFETEPDQLLRPLVLAENHF